MAAIVVVSDSKIASPEQFDNGVHDDNHDAVHEICETVTSVFAVDGDRKDHHIHVSSTKKPRIFYLNLAKKFLSQYKVVQLSALGSAITTLIIISENLKRNGWAIEKSVTVSTITSKEDPKGRMFHKPKIDILLVKAEQTDTTSGATTSEKDADNSAITE